MMVESGVGEAGHGNTMLVDQGAHPELLFGGVDEEPDKGYHEDDGGGEWGKWKEKGSSYTWPMEEAKAAKGPTPELI